MKRSTPESEELAAMQAGFEDRPVVMRRDGGQEAARPRMGEFVSGNYFRMFGLQPAKGRLLTDTDDVAGAPLTAVMSYATWKTGGDPAKPYEIVGVVDGTSYTDVRWNGTHPMYFGPLTQPSEAGTRVRS